MLAATGPAPRKYSHPHHRACRIRRRLPNWARLSDLKTPTLSDAPPAPRKNPYEFQADEVAEPPRTFGGIMKKIGPGIILSASIVGSGELIATTTLGAEVGYTALWI